MLSFFAPHCYYEWLYCISPHKTKPRLERREYKKVVKQTYKKEEDLGQYIMMMSCNISFTTTEMILLLLLTTSSLLVHVAAAADGDIMMSLYDWPGDCSDPRLFFNVPFTASAYDSCTAYQDVSKDKLGDSVACGAMNSLSLDGEVNNDLTCMTRVQNSIITEEEDFESRKIDRKSNRIDAFLSKHNNNRFCHVAYTEPNEWLEYSFMTPTNDYPSNYNPVYNIVLRVASKYPRDVLLQLDNGGNTIETIVTTNPPSHGENPNSNELYYKFHDIVWENVQFDTQNVPERVFVEFLDGSTNFCSITIEETTWLSSENKRHTIPFDTSSQNYISFIEKSKNKRSGSCGVGPMDSQPNNDAICNSRGGDCNIGWTQSGEQVQYLIINNVNEQEATTTRRDVTLRMASLKSNKNIRIEIEGTNQILDQVETPGLGYREYRDIVWSNVSFPRGTSRLIVTFLSGGINLCSVSVK